MIDSNIAYFNNVYYELVNNIQSYFDSPLTVGEKASIKECLKYTVEIHMLNSSNGMVGQDQLDDARGIFMAQYGQYTPITRRDFILIHSPETRKYINKIRDEFLLL